MLYPKKISSKKVNRFINTFSISVIALSIVLLIINYLTTPNIYWSHICICGFLYIFLTVRYSINKTRNISGYVVIQTILSVILIYYIDYRIGYSGWSLNIAFPIIIIIANLTMFIVTIFNFKNYGKYAINQLIIVLLSLSTIYFVHKGYINNNVLIKTSIIISIFNFLVSIILCFKEFKEEIIKKFNI